MAITRFKDAPSTDTPINSANLNGNFDELGAKVGTSIDSNYRTNILYNKELFTTANLTDGYLNNDGTITTNQQFSVSDYINIYGANKLTISGNSGASERICFYNSSKTFVSYVNTATNTTLTFDVPSDAYYIRVTVKNDNLGIYHLQKGTSIITPTINVDGEDIYVKGQNEVYSTVEQIIGTWNGKPRYCRVIDTTLTTGSPIANIPNIRIKHIYGTVKRGTQEWDINTIYPNDYSICCTAFYDEASGDLFVVYGTSFTAGSPVSVTLEYTKTTD